LGRISQRNSYVHVRRQLGRRPRQLWPPSLIQRRSSYNRQDESLPHAARQEVCELLFPRMPFTYSGGLQSGDRCPLKQVQFFSSWTGDPRPIQPTCWEPSEAVPDGAILVCCSYNRRVRAAGVLADARGYGFVLLNAAS
jgi:hypothetical protein